MGCSFVCLPVVFCPQSTHFSLKIILFVTWNNWNCLSVGKALWGKACGQTEVDCSNIHPLSL